MAVSGWWPLGLVFAGVVAVSIVWVSREHYLYSWDLAYYHGRAVDLAHLVTTDPKEAAHQVGYSVFRGINYSDLFSLPLLPFVLVLGHSRRVFIGSMAAIYLFPFVVLCGAITSAATPHRRRLAFAFGILAALLTPWTWIPTLRGYPDSGAAAMVLAALLLVHRDPRLRRWRTVLGVGSLLAVSVIFRRYYMYAAIGTMAAIALILLSETSARHERRKEWIRIGTRLAALGATAGVVLGGLSPGFVARLIRVNFSTLYSSYDNTPVHVAGFYASGYGGVVLAVAAAGLATGWLRMRRRRPDACRMIALVGVSTGFTLALWVFQARQNSECYSTLFTAGVVLGLALAGWTVVDLICSAAGFPGDRTARIMVARVGLVVTALALGANALVAVGTSSGATPFGPTFSRPYQRHDLAQVDALVRELRANGGPGDPVFVAASSQLLNEDLIRNAERRLVGATHTRLAFAGAPQIDSADQYPIQALIRARLVVVADPAQFHINPSQQKVVSTAIDVLRSTTKGMGSEFTPLPGEFHLDGMVVHVLRRTRPASADDVVESLQRVKAAMTRTPGRQPAWVAVTDDPNVVVEDLASATVAGIGAHGTSIEVTVTRDGPLPTLVGLEYEMLLRDEVDMAAAARVSVVSGPCTAAHLAPGHPGAATTVEIPEAPTHVPLLTLVRPHWPASAQGSCLLHIVL